MDGHDAHGVVVGLGQDRLGDAGAVGELELDPAEVLAKVSPGGLAPRSCLVDDEADPAPHVARAAFGESEVHGPPVAGDPVQQFGGRAPVPLLVEAAQVGQPGMNAVAVVGLAELGVEVAPRADPGMEPEEVVVAAGEQWRAQRGDDVEEIGGVGHRPEHHKRSRTARVE